jgi:hypothetical protein
VLETRAGSWISAMACASGVKSADGCKFVRQSSASKMAEAHSGRCRVSLFPLLLRGSQGTLCCRDDDYDLSGFDVPEHFREPEVLGHQNHDWLG